MDVKLVKPLMTGAGAAVVLIFYLLIRHKGQYCGIGGGVVFYKTPRNFLCLEFNVPVFLNIYNS